MLIIINQSVLLKVFYTVLKNMEIIKKAINFMNHDDHFPNSTELPLVSNATVSD